MNVVMQWLESVNWTHVAEGFCSHALLVIVASTMTLMGGWLMGKWRAARYNCLMNVRVCAVEEVPTLKCQSLSSDIIWEGQAVDFIPDLKAVRSLAKSVRKSRTVGLLTLKSDDAERILQLCANQVRQRFPQGFVANAMDDKDVTKTSFMMAIVKDPESTSPATLLLITTTDWSLIKQGKVKALGDDVQVEKWIANLNEETTVRIRMFM